MYLRKNLRKILLNKNGVQPTAVNVMGENGTVKSWYRNRQPNMTRNEDKNSTDPKKPKKRPVRDRIKTFRYLQQTI